MKRSVLILALLLLVPAAAGGYLAGRWTARPTTASAPPPAQGAQVYTCSMHPQVRLDGPGVCPICEMPLVPAGSASRGSGPPVLQLSEHALSMAGVETTPVARRELTRQLRAVGKIQYNESSLATVTARVDGYAERLFVNFTGVEIKSGDHLAEIYSPELSVAEQELLIAVQGQAQSPLADTARLKLRRFGLTDRQIEELVETGKISDRVTLYSPISGTVIEKMIVENSAFKAGDVLYRVANLDTVWVYLDVYEIDLAWVRYGQTVELTAEALPGRTFHGMVTFVQPIVDERTRTIRVPVHIENADHALKPGMFVSAVIEAVLGRDGRAAPTGVEGMWSCPMHPQVLRGEAGACPFCEMPLEQIPGAPPPHGAPAPGAAAAWLCPMRCEGEKTYDEPGRCPVCHMALQQQAGTGGGAGASEGLLAVPVSAVLDSGTRKIVYVQRSPGLFEARQITTGPRTGEFYPVLAGLSEGEAVVTRGGFLIDSQFQITGLPSLFYPGGLEALPEHEHGSR